MSAIVDTSVIVRYLTGDPPDLADRAARILDGAEGLLIPPVVLAETAYVLTTVYGVEREVVVDALVELLQKENIHPLGLDKAAAVEGLLLCRPSRRVSFADALVWAHARSSGTTRIYSFDRRFPDSGVDVSD